MKSEIELLLEKLDENLINVARVLLMDLGSLIEDLEDEKAELENELHMREGEVIEQHNEIDFLNETIKELGQELENERSKSA